MFGEYRLKIINYYNNKNHRLIGTSPNKAYKITDGIEIKKINEIKDKEFKFIKKINGKLTYLKKR